MKAEFDRDLVDDEVLGHPKCDGVDCHEGKRTSLGGMCSVCPFESFGFRELTPEERAEYRAMLSRLGQPLPDGQEACGMAFDFGSLQEEYAELERLIVITPNGKGWCRCGDLTDVECERCAPLGALPWHPSRPDRPEE